jgi:hypothetical protein
MDSYVAVAMSDVSTEEGRRSARGQAVYRVDPRRIGIIPGPMASLHSMALEDLLVHPDRRESSVEEGREGGAPVWRVKYVRRDGGVVTLRIDAGRGYSVIDSSVEAVGPSGNTITDRIVSELEQYGPDGIWLPSTTTYTRQIGDRTVETAVYGVNRAEFNTPVDPKTFTLAGMDIPPGTMVRETPPTTRGTRYWDGNELKTRDSLAFCLMHLCRRKDRVEDGSLQPMFSC